MLRKTLRSILKITEYLPYFTVYFLIYKTTKLIIRCLCNAFSIRFHQTFQLFDINFIYCYKSFFPILKDELKSKLKTRIPFPVNDFWEYFNQYGYLGDRKTVYLASCMTSKSCFVWEDIGKWHKSDRFNGQNDFKLW